MPSCRVSWKDSHGETHVGILIQFVYSMSFDTVGMVIKDSAFVRVPYNALTFLGW